MAKGIDFPEANFTYSAPTGMETSVYDLRVYRDWDNHQIVSKWELNSAEIEEINRTGHVWLFIQGDDHPIVYVTGGFPFHSRYDKDQLELPLEQPSAFERATETSY